VKKDKIFPGRRHDHGVCIEIGLKRAEAACAAGGARLTPNRRAVLEVLLSDHRPLSAYEIAERIDWQGRKGAPVQVYRALDFFETLGLVHRIESRNAYLACSQADGAHGAQFLVCRDCGRVAEASDSGLERGLRELAGKAGFTVEAPVVEIKGLCPDCTGRTDG
jgi:Fur family zinc uptake transcriptional regulator